MQIAASPADGRGSDPHDPLAILWATQARLIADLDAPEDHDQNDLESIARSLGLSGVSEFVDKVVHGEQTEASMQRALADALARVDMLRAAKDRVRAELLEADNAELAWVGKQRRLVDQLQAAVLEKSKAAESAQQRNSALQQVLASVRQGIDALLARLRSARDSEASMEPQLVRKSSVSSDSPRGGPRRKHDQLPDGAVPADATAELLTSVWLIDSIVRWNGSPPTCADGASSQISGLVCKQAPADSQPAERRSPAIRPPRVRAKTEVRPIAILLSNAEIRVALQSSLAGISVQEDSDVEEEAESAASDEGDRRRQFKISSAEFVRARQSPIHPPHPAAHHHLARPPPRPSAPTPATTRPRRERRVQSPQ